jgi:hypothetical protein
MFLTRRLVCVYISEHRAQKGSTYNSSPYATRTDGSSVHSPLVRPSLGQIRAIKDMRIFGPYGSYEYGQSCDGIGNGGKLNQETRAHPRVRERCLRGKYEWPRGSDMLDDRLAQAQC